jgi:predicted permease
MWRRRRDREQDLEREMRDHLQLEAAEREADGLPADQAREAARRTFGNVTRVKEEVREMWGWTLWETLLHDVRYASRMLRKSPGFAATAVLTLALGIGASTAVFTVVDCVVLKPLSYSDSGRLVAAWERVRFLGDGPTGPNLRHLDIWRREAKSFSGLTVLRQGAAGLTLGNGYPQWVGTVTSAPNLFDVLQVKPLLGRTFLPADGTSGRDRVAILTYGIWRNLLGGDPGVVGKTIRLGDVPREVVGVLPQSFQFPNRNALRSFHSKQTASSVPQPAIFIPAVIEPESVGWNSDYGNWVALARLNPGVTVKQADTELNLLAARILEQMPAGQRDTRPDALGATVQPLQDVIVGDSRTGLWFLLAAVIGLMLIACVNLANAQLSRTLSRHRDTAVRTALGAPRWRLVWNSLVENLVLAMIGGSVGVALAVGGLSLFRRFAPIDLPRLAEVHLNTAVLLFAVALTVGSSLLFGLLPALRLLRTDPQEFLQHGNQRSLGSRQGRRLRTWLIALQVFGCTVLLLVTGLCSRSLLYLIHQDKGLDTRNVALAEVNLPRQTYGSAENRIAFIDGVLRNLRAAPGVQTAGMVSAMPLEGESWIDGIRRLDRPQQQGATVNLRWVSPDYFTAIRARLVAGRFFEERDRKLSSVVISEAQANSLWPGENPIGSQVRIARRQFTVIGIVGDSRNTSLKTPPVKMAFLHYADLPPYSTVFAARSDQSANALLSNMRQAIWKHAPGVTVAKLKAMDSQVNDSLATERFQTSVLLSFGISALFLSMLGIYGVLSYSITVRKQEIGLRMALGGTPGKVYRLTMGEVGGPVLCGLVAGLLASVLVSRVIQKLLYGVAAVDPVVMASVAALFLTAATVAALLPARRAARVDPIEALRSE